MSASRICLFSCRGGMRLGLRGLAKHTVSLVLGTGWRVVVTVAGVGYIISPSTALNEVCSSCPH